MCFGSKSVTSIWPGVTMSPTSTFLSITMPSMGERMVAQSSDGLHFVDGLFGARRSASADRSASDLLIVLLLG